MAVALTRFTGTIDLSPGGEVALTSSFSSGVALLVSVAIAQGFYVQGLDSLRALVRCSAISATAQGTDIRIWGILPPVTFDPATGTRTSAALATASVANNVDGVLSVALNGESVVEFELTRSASSGCTLGLITFAGQRV